MKILNIFLLLMALRISASAQSNSPVNAPVHTRERVHESVKPKAKMAVKDSSTPVKKEILKLEHEWAQALLDEDVTKLKTLLADNLQYTRSNGKVENKASYLKSLREGKTTYSMVKRDNVKIQVNGETAIVTARLQAKLQNKPNPPIATTARYLHVYVRKDGRWLLTTHQSTEIK